MRHSIEFAHNIRGGGSNDDTAYTGLGQIYELVTQLRGEAGARHVDNARIGIAQNGGGIIGVEEAVVCVTVVGG